MPNVDLNRNYPDPQDGNHPDGHSYQLENIAQMNFMKQHHFLLSANFHGGAEVVNYPWDTWSRRHADDAWYQFISREYADTVHLVNSTYMNDLNNGITNGYDWYEVAGGRQDYVNYFLHSREVTIELSSYKTPSASTLPNYWNYNKNSFLNFIQQCGYGIQGTVTDSITGNPLNAMIYIENHDQILDSSMVFTNATTGKYYRLIEPGTWDITFSAFGYIRIYFKNNYRNSNN
ncbi:MAG: hypothetical protein GXO79_12690 [Chlorobi bacterium]|nr:hypothetical protein [Chlorobiota bacterium]